MDRLTAFDSSFLANERSSSHMHVGAFLICEGEAPTLDEFKALIASRLHLLPRMRQRLLFPPLGLGRPLWVDYPEFDLDEHVFAAELPAPGTEAQLKEMAGKMFSEPMDRSRPVWELTIVSGLEGGRCAVLDKFHHAFADGIAGVDVGVVLFDLQADAPPPGEPEPWEPQPHPGKLGLLALGARQQLSTWGALARRWGSAIVHPARSARRLADNVAAIKEVVVNYVLRAPRVQLSGHHGPGRLMTYQRFSFFDFKDVAKHYGGTINDVVIGVTSGALRKWMIERGEDPSRELRALAPISTRRADEHDELGNRLVGMRIPVSVQIEDADERMRHVVEEMEKLKASKQELAGHVIWNLNECFNDLAPPLLLKPSARINFSTRLFNLILTNFPGPNFPLWVLGRPCTDIIAYGFLARGHRIMISIMSFHGRIAFALLADDESMADVERIAELLQESFADIQAASVGPRAELYDPQS